MVAAISGAISGPVDVIVLAIRGYSGVRRLVEWSKGFIQTHTEDESE